MSRRTTLPAHWTPIQEAAYLTVHEFRTGQSTSGATALAPLVGKTPRTLDNEVNPDASNAKLSIEDAVTLMHATQDFRLLQSMGATLGFAMVEVADFTGMHDAALLDAYADWNAEIGETHSAIRDSLIDGKVTRIELENIRREMFEDFSKSLGLLARLEALVDDES